MSLRLVARCAACYPSFFFIVRLTEGYAVMKRRRGIDEDDGDNDTRAKLEERKTEIS